MAPFYGWGSTASRLEPLQGGSLLTKHVSVNSLLLFTLGMLITHLIMQKYSLYDFISL